MMILYGLLGLTILLLAYFIALYNGLIRARNEVDNGWSQIDVQLKRRHNLVPNLVATVQGYAKHETSLLEEVTAARAHASSLASKVSALGVGAASGVGAAFGAGELALAETALSKALGGLFAVVENYPDLKANQNFLALQEELASTENRIGFARQAFNDATSIYNTRRETFPANMIAGGFVRREFFKIEDSSQRAVPVVAPLAAE
jgi:LemA protein